MNFKRQSLIIAWLLMMGWGHSAQTMAQEPFMLPQDLLVDHAVSLVEPADAVPAHG